MATMRASSTGIVSKHRAPGVNITVAGHIPIQGFAEGCELGIVIGIHPRTHARQARRFLAICLIHSFLARSPYFNLLAIL